MDLLSLIGITQAQAQNSAGWGNVAKEVEETGFSWTEPLFGGTWMAWTGATAALFVGIFSAMFILTIIEIRRPGGAWHRIHFSGMVGAYGHAIVGASGLKYWLGYILLLESVTA